MATITSAQSGNWSATSTWVGGAVPGTADTAVAATGHVVTLDVDATVVQFSQSGTGKYVLGNGRTMTGNIVNSGAIQSGGGAVEVTSTTTATINGNVQNSASTGAATAVLVSGSGTLSINGNLTNSGTSGAVIPAAVRVTGIGPTITITGTVNGSPAASGQNATALSVESSSTVNVVGSVLGATGTTGSASAIQVSAGTVNVTGAVSGSSTVGSPTINIPGSAGTVNITGNVTGGGVNDAIAIQATGANATVTIVGTVTAGSGARAHAVSSSATANGVIMTGNIVDSQQGTSAIYARLLRLGATNNGYTRYANSTGFPNGGLVSRVSPNNTTGMVAANNVRLGTVYGFNNELTGTLAVPPANSVASGVPVDNTVGTAALSPNDLAAMIGAQVAAAVSSPPVV